MVGKSKERRDFAKAHGKLLGICQDLTLAEQLVRFDAYRSTDMSYNVSIFPEELPRDNCGYRRSHIILGRMDYDSPLVREDF